MKQHKVYSFEKLNVWNESRALVKFVYNQTANFPASEQFGLQSQMRRTAISISSNIVEGSGRWTKLDQKNFYKNAYSSLMELLCQSMLAFDLNYLSEDTLYQLRNQADEIASKLGALYNSLNPKPSTLNCPCSTH